MWDSFGVKNGKKNINFFYLTVKHLEQQLDLFNYLI